MPTSIKRRLELWEILVEPAREGSGSPPLAEIFRHIQGLPFKAEAPSDPPERLRELQIENSILVADCGTIEPDYIMGVYGRGKEVDVPELRKGRRKRTLRLRPGEYMEYASHFVVFDKGRVIFERNPEGPAPPSLGVYIEAKCPEMVRRVYVNRVPRGSFLERFKKIKAVRSIVIRLGVKAIREFARSSQDGLWTGAQKEYDMGTLDTIMIGLTIGRAPGGIRPDWLRRIPSIVSDPEVSDDIRRLEINARMEDSGEIEVLRLIKGVSMEKTVKFKVSGENKNLDSDQVYAMIHTQYPRFKRILERVEDEGYLDSVHEELD